MYDNVAQFLKFIIARNAVYVAREAGKSLPSVKD
jgi:hypothetical protein